ncbi:MAG: ECF-type sigma factor [Bryobacteraceae bacterium]
MGNPSDVTSLLVEYGSGKREAMNDVMRLVYDELRKLAHARRAQWQDWKTPGTTSLVHEVYLNLVDQTRARWEDRKHFFYFASVAMRNLLIDHARRAGRQKREGERVQVSLDDIPIVSEQRSDELLALDEVLTRLQQSDERLSRIVECRVFGGLTVEETAETLSLSPSTVKRGWDAARAWLYKEMKPHQLL